MKNKKSIFIYNTLSLLLLLSFAQSQTLEVKDIGQGGAQTSTMIDTGLGLHNGVVWVWGFKGSGQQGNGIQDQNEYRFPMKVNKLPKIVAVIGGAHHIIATDFEGYLWGWGQNGYGEVGCDGKPNNIAYVLEPCKLKTSTGEYLQGVSQIASAGEYHTVFLDKHGDVYTSGLGTLGRLGHGYVPPNARQPKKVNLNGEHARLIGAAYEGSFAVTHEGNVWVWGDNEGGGLTFPITVYTHIWTPVRSEKLKSYADKITAIGGGQLWGQALLLDGRVIGWGQYAALGQSCGRPVDLSLSSNIVFVPIEKVIQIAMRYESTIALTEDNEIYTWGALDKGSVYENIQGHCPKKAPLSAAFRKEHGKVVKVGTGKHHITYEMEDGSVWGVGYNAGGQIKWGAGTPILNFPGVRLNNIPYP